MARVPLVGMEIAIEVITHAAGVQTPLRKLPAALFGCARASRSLARTELPHAARRIQYDLVNLFDTLIYSAEFPDGFRATVKLRGFSMGHGCQPLSPEQTTELATLSKSLQCLLAEHGFTDEPVGGCPIPSGENQDLSEVSEIVARVVSELHRRGMM